jgi:hypothetical protein
MTILLDTAALAFLLLVLTFVPALALRQEAKITRELREAAEHADRPEFPGARTRPAARPEPIRHMRARHNM